MRIFLSYPRKDMVKARQLQKVLSSGGHTVWVDDHLVTGQPWPDQLEAEIKQADAVALALTPNWVESPYCQWEFVTAVEYRKKVIPVLLTDGTKLPSRISRYQYADLSGGFNDAAVQKLLDDLIILATVIEPLAIVGMDKAEYEQQIDYGSENIIGNGNTIARTGSISIGGKVTGGNINIGGSQTFHGNVTIHTNLNDLEDDPRNQLYKLIEQLNFGLAAIPPEDAEVIAALTQDAVDEASKDKPNKRLLEIKGENLKKATEDVPAIALIAGRIAKTLLMIG